MNRMLNFYNWFMSPIPGDRAMRFKIWWLRRCGIDIGICVHIEPNVHFDLRNAKVKIADYVRIESNVSFVLNNASLCIGDRSAISSYVKFKGSGNVEIGKQVLLREFSFVHILENTIIIGDNVCVAENVILESLRDAASGGVLKIGSNVDVMQYTFLSANGGSRVTIGNDCKIAHNVSIKATHHLVDPSSDCIGSSSLFDDITVNDGCWICAGAIIVPGVVIGAKNVIGAGAVVTKSTPEYSLNVGVPSMVKKTYSGK